MSERTEEQVARDKAAIESMRHAKSNMDTALKRIETLEWAVKNAIDALKRAKADISPSVYCYPTGSDRMTVHARIDFEIANLVKSQ